MHYNRGGQATISLIATSDMIWKTSCTFLPLHSQENLWVRYSQLNWFWKNGVNFEDFILRECEMIKQRNSSGTVYYYATTNSKFVEKQQIIKFADIENISWQCDLHYLCENKAHLNKLNLKMQGNSKVIYGLAQHITEFKVVSTVRKLFPPYFNYYYYLLTKIKPSIRPKFSLYSSLIINFLIKTFMKNIIVRLFEHHSFVIR